MIGTPLEPMEPELDEPLLESGRRRTWRAMRRSPAFWLGGLMVGTILIVAAFAPWLAPHDPNYEFPNGTSFIGAPLGHTSQFYLGTDQNGRDLLSRLIYGARLSLGISILANLLAVFVGVSLGAAAGWWRGWLEAVIMRFTDVMIAFPVLLLALALVAIEGPSLTIIIIVIGMVSWTGLCRITYGQVLSYREREWIDAARATGVGDFRILVRHILPHLTGPIIVYGTLGVGLTVVFEGSLEYLGLGVPAPAASWGTMIQAGSKLGLQYYWLILFPSLALFMTVLGFNLLGDAFRDALDPRGPLRR
jgi:peptide/nickel transport system permease protein